MTENGNTELPAIEDTILKPPLTRRDKLNNVKNYVVKNAEPLAVGAIMTTAVFIYGSLIRNLVAQEDKLIVTKKQKKRFAQGEVDGVLPGIEYHLRGKKKNTRVWLVNAMDNENLANKI